MVQPCFRYIKDPRMTPKRKQLFVYMLERIDRETKGDKITIIFDCQAAGVRNFEIEAVQFIMQVTWPLSDMATVLLTVAARC